MKRIIFNLRIIFAMALSGVSFLMSSQGHAGSIDQTTVRNLDEAKKMAEKMRTSPPTNGFVLKSAATKDQGSGTSGSIKIKSNPNGSYSVTHEQSLHFGSGD